MSKYAFYGLFLQVFFLSILLAGTGTAQNESLKDIKLSVQWENVKLKNVFEELNAKTGFKFNFNDGQVNVNKNITVDIQEKSMDNVLRTLSEKANLKFRRINNNIHVASKKRSQEAVVEYLSLEDVSIAGKITDENGEGLPGASIVEKGTTNGTTTNLEGDYKLTVSDEATLVISYVGYINQEVNIAGRTSIDVQLNVDAEQLNEVIVVGYGTQERASVTGAIAGVSAKQFENFPITSFDQGIAGQVAGVNVAQGSGSPGTSPSITVRGTSTITAGTKPLLVIDGFPAEDLNFSDINPNDIESVQILKDAASAAVYGSRAGNGVLIVTTKNGQKDGLSVNFNAYSGVQKVTNTYDLANAYEWAEFQSENYLSNGTFADASEIPPLYQQYIAGTPGLVDTDWQDEFFRNAGIQSYQVSLSGGNDNTTFYVSGEFFDQDGVIEGTDFKRYSLRTNLRTKLLDNPGSSFLKGIKLGINFSPTHTTNQRVSESHHNNDGIVITGVFAYPNFAARNADGSLNISEQIRFGQAPIGEGLGNNGARFENPLAVALQRDNLVKRSRLLGSTYLDFELLEGLSFKTLIGFNYSGESNRLFRPSTIGRRRDPVPVTAIASYGTTNVLNWISENTLTFTKTLNENHNLSVLAGYTFQKENIQTSFISGQEFATNVGITLDQAGTITSASSHEEEWALLSYLGRINYDFKGKYLISASIRRDGFSRFGEDSKYGVFPAVSAGWRISEEDFFAGLQNTVSDLKLRASYGRTGNAQIANYGALPLLGRANYGGQIGLTPVTSPNANTSWEDVDQLDIGFDIGLLDDKITITADYYKSTTKGILLEVPVPSQSGFTSSLQNLGRVENKGIEFAIAARDVKLGPISWSPSFNISTNNNTVLELGPGQERIVSKHHITEVGSSLGQFYGWVSTGIYNTQAEVDASAHESGAEPGDYIWEDVNNDGTIDDEDRQVLGSPLPDFTYGFSSSFKYKGFDLSVLFQGSEGAELFNFTRFFLTLEGGFSNALAERVNERWRSESQPGNGVWGRAGSTQTNFDRSNLHIEDASFLRVRNITVGYTFPTELTQNISIQKARIYVSSINPFTFTDYSGYNPEGNGGAAEALTGSVTGGPLTPGVDWGNYPIAKSFTVGVNITL